MKKDIEHRKSEFIRVRTTPHLSQEIDRISKSRGVRKSDFVRGCIDDFISSYRLTFLAGSVEDGEAEDEQQS